MKRRELIPKHSVPDPHNLQLLLKVRTHYAPFVAYSSEEITFPFLAVLVTRMLP